MPVDRKLFAEMFKLFDSALGLTHHALMVSIFLLYSLFLQHQSKLAKLLFRNIYEWIVCPIKNVEKSYSTISRWSEVEIYFVKWKLNHNGLVAQAARKMVKSIDSKLQVIYSSDILIRQQMLCSTQISASVFTKKVSNISLVDYWILRIFPVFSFLLFSPTLYPTLRWAASDHSFFIYSIFWFWFYSIVCWLFHSISNQSQVEKPLLFRHEW